MDKFNKIMGFAATMAIVMAFSIDMVSAATLKETDDAAKTQYDKTRQAYQNEVSAYKTARQNFMNAKTKFQKAKNATNKTEYEAQAKTFLQKSISAMIHYLQAVRNKTENVRGISDADKTNILADIDKDINWLTAEQEKLGSATTTEQLKEKATVIREYWNTAKTTFKKASAKIWIARLNFLIAKAEGLSEKTNAKIQELKTVGKNTSKLEAWQKELNQKIDAAKVDKLKAEEQLPNISNVNADQIFKTIRRFVQDANQYMRKAHSQLAQIVQELKKVEK